MDFSWVEPVHNLSLNLTQGCECQNICINIKCCHKKLRVCGRQQVQQILSVSTYLPNKLFKYILITVIENPATVAFSIECICLLQVIKKQIEFLKDRNGFLWLQLFTYIHHFVVFANTTNRDNGGYCTCETGLNKMHTMQWRILLYNPSCKCDHESYLNFSLSRVGCLKRQPVCPFFEQHRASGLLQTATSGSCLREPLFSCVYFRPISSSTGAVSDANTLLKKTLTGDAEEEVSVSLL